MTTNIIHLIIIALCLCTSVSHADLGKADIYEPTFVGRPLSNAGVGLIEMDDGSIRLYQSDGSRYMISTDDGLTWQTKDSPESFPRTDLVRKDPLTGNFLSVGKYFSARSTNGIDGDWTTKDVEAINGTVVIRKLYFVNDNKRFIVPGHDGSGCYTLYSDDRGKTWYRSNKVTTPPHRAGGIHKGTRWNHNAAEPTVIELNDGRLWGLIRNAQDFHYEMFSSDYGTTWTDPTPSRFYGTITMPTLGRLDDGRILLIWNNTTPLPELSRATGWPEDVFTNRDAIHAAISDDDGQTWTGFRELWLDYRRNASDYAETKENDRGTQQNEFIDIGPNKVLVSFGQHKLHRSIIIFDLDWLYEKKRSCDFSDGLEQWSTFKYIAGIRGHCAYNRKDGAKLIDHPNKSGSKTLRITRPSDPSLQCENDGATWNFPAGSKGQFTTKILLPINSKGARISLIDRWFNPTDVTTHMFSMYDLNIAPDGSCGNGINIEPGKWHELKFIWNGLTNKYNNVCDLYIDGSLQKAKLPLNNASINGISYVHFISTAQSEDNNGLLVESVIAEVK
ncbi:MAG: exo-alpha-sialidase [Anaerohalosphaera sp.]|nr:exo-alpha-sialidase [Anaerohalosphaera sp.]